MGKLKFKYTLVIVEGEDRWFVGTCPEVKGTVSQGRTIKSARRQLLEAIELIEEYESNEKAKALVTAK